LLTSKGSATILARHAVLVIEDNHDGRESLRQLLEGTGHLVRVAANGPEGVRLALEFEPDLAIVDLDLPCFDGFEVARRIRQALGDDVLLIANTGSDTPSLREEAAAAGFDEYTVKPLLALELRRRLG
jgi:CheY-like chemotaxis protein